MPASNATPPNENLLPVKLEGSPREIFDLIVSDRDKWLANAKVLPVEVMGLGKRGVFAFPPNITAARNPHGLAAENIFLSLAGNGREWTVIGESAATLQQSILFKAALKVFKTSGFEKGEDGVWHLDKNAGVRRPLRPETIPAASVATAENS